MMSAATDERFARHLLPGWNQQRLADATAVIAGIGALGNEVAQCLALAGTGRLVLCDPDRVERSNLSRAPLFRERHVGCLKVEAAAETLADLAPASVVDARPRRFEAAVGLAELRDASVILGCLDSRSARLELAGRCGLVRAPWIDGATGDWSGEVRHYLDPDGPCYGCGQDDAARGVNDQARPCHAFGGDGSDGEDGPAAAAAPLSAIVGAQVALAALRFLMGLKTPAGVVVFDAVTGTSELVRQARDPTCPYHRAIRTVSRVRVGPADRVRDLVDALGGQTPLAWNPVALGAPGALPRRTTLELTRVPDRTLAEVGIPPREILAFRSGEGIDYTELE